MKYCAKCGNTCNDVDSFCPVCGNVFNAPNVPPMNQPAPQMGYGMPNMGMPPIPSVQKKHDIYVIFNFVHNILSQLYSGFIALSILLCSTDIDIWENEISEYSQKYRDFEHGHGAYIYVAGDPIFLSIALILAIIMLGFAITNLVISIKRKKDITDKFSNIVRVVGSAVAIIVAIFGLD